MAVLDIRKFFFSISMPFAIIAIALVMQYSSFSLPESLRTVARFLPYLFIFASLIFAWVFHHSREFHILILCGSTYWVMQNTGLIENGDSFNVFLLYSLICLLLPLNITVISMLSERGIINFYGIKRLVILILQAMFIYWVSQADSHYLTLLFEYKFIHADFIKYNTIPHVAQVVFLLCFVYLLIRNLLNPNLLLAANTSVIISVWYSLNVYNESYTAILWYSVIGIVLLASMMLNSKQLAFLDELTNLPSRRALKQYLGTLGRNYSIAMVDIDHFKKINDKYGHDIGDQVLRRLSSFLRKVQGGGRAFRYGGEEFTIVFSGKDIDEAYIYTDHLREMIADNPFTVRNRKRPKQKPDKPIRSSPLKEIDVTVSIGIAQRSELLLTTEEVIKLADENLYKAKKKGRNQVVK
jgi:diguanylate cyclase (GGDEF)-like protein